MQIDLDSYVLHPSPRDPHPVLMVKWLPQLSDATKGLIYMHGQGMVHGDLKGVRLWKLQPRPSLQRHPPIRQIYWLTKPAMPASLILVSLRSSLTQRLWAHTYRAVPPDG